MGSYWAIAPICFLSAGLAAVLVFERIVSQRAPAIFSFIPTFLSLAITIALYVVSQNVPLEMTLFSWSAGTSLSVDLALRVDAWAALLAAMALFLGLYAQIDIAAQTIHQPAPTSGVKLSEEAGENESDDPALEETAP